MYSQNQFDGLNFFPSSPSSYPPLPSSSGASAGNFFLDPPPEPHANMHHHSRGPHPLVPYPPLPPTPTVPPPNAGPQILALLNSNNNRNKQVGSTVSDYGKRVFGDYVAYDVDAVEEGREPPQQLEATPITTYGSDPELLVGRQIAVSKHYVCYGLKGGNVRVLNFNIAARSLLCGHTKRVTDMVFYADDVHLLASVGVDGRVYVWKICEGPDEQDKLQITGNAMLMQACLIGVVCFCCPGMFNALSGMGGGGQVDTTAANNANTALYTTFTVFGILGGGIYNILGPQVTLILACSTYVLYAGSFLYYNHYKHQSLAVAAGAILGVGAGLLWAAEGAIMTSYPPPNRKGTYISIFWSIFNMGGVNGGLIPFILNYNRNEAASINDGTYIGFMCFMSGGALLSLVILPPSRVIRDDGTSCTNIKYSNVSTEITQILKLFLNWKMLLIFPASWASNFFYSYQFNNVNALQFNLRTRGLNNVFYWGAQMLGSVGIGCIFDFSFPSREKRGIVGIGVVALIGSAIWSGGLANQLTYSHDKPPAKLDFKNSGSDFAGPFVLYFCYGLLDAMFQSMVYWVIGALADDSVTLSRYSGFYKGVQSAGAAVAWQVDTHKVPLLSQLIVNWSLTTISYPLLVLLQAVAMYKSKDPKTSDEEEMLENLFDSLCCALMPLENKERFVKAEGVELIITKQKKSAAIRALDFAMTKYPPACERFVDVFGLKTTFTAFMGKIHMSKKNKKDMKAFNWRLNFSWFRKVSKHVERLLRDVYMQILIYLLEIKALVDAFHLEDKVVEKEGSIVRPLVKYIREGVECVDKLLGKWASGVH